MAVWRAVMWVLMERGVDVPRGHMLIQGTGQSSAGSAEGCCIGCSVVAYRLGLNWATQSNPSLEQLCPML